MIKKSRENKSIKFSRTGIYIVLSVLVIFSFLSIAASQAQGTDKKDLKKFYKNNCVKCHGVDGSATGEDGKKLKGQDFTDLDWRNSTKDEKMVKTIMKGIFFGFAMPAFKDELTEDEAQSMVTEIIRKSKKGKEIAPDNK